MKERRAIFFQRILFSRRPRASRAAFAGLCLALCLATAPVRPASDFQWTFDNDDSFDYKLTSVSSPSIYDAALPAFDPTLNLFVGKRYAVTVPNFGVHPFQILAKGGSAASDVVLLSQGTGVGSFEGDAGVAWVDGGTSTVEFILTSSLADAMSAGSLNPGYRCGIHTSTMRGDFVVYGNGQPIADPIVARIPKGDIRIELQLVADGLAAPLGVADAGDGTGRLFIHDQAGLVHILQNDALLPQPFLDVRNRLVTLGIGGPNSFDERGLLGFAFHPSFTSNGKVYTYTSEPVSASADFTVTLSGAPNHQSVIAEWVVSSTDSNRVDRATRRELLRIDQPQFNHDGGTLRFGPDDFLYIALGDGGSADDEADGHGPRGNGQDATTVLGSILRIDVDGSNSANGQYGIPAGNPFVGGSGLDEIFAYGFRNPYAFSFDALTGDLYAGDVGQNHIEEIDIVTAGGNYGWRLKEGSFYFDPNPSGSGFVTTEPVAPIPPGVVDPIAEYDHDDGLSIIGGFVYRGSALPSLDGRYVFGDFGTSFASPSGRLFYLDASGEPVEFVLGAGEQPFGLWLKGFGEDREGNVYICGSGEIGPFGATGQVLKISPLGTSSVADSLWMAY